MWRSTSASVVATINQCRRIGDNAPSNASGDAPSAIRSIGARQMQMAGGRPDVVEAEPLLQTVKVDPAPCSSS